jgi:hypothetical protein
MFFGLQKVADEIGFELGFEGAGGALAFGALAELRFETSFEAGKIAAPDGIAGGNGDLSSSLDQNAVIHGKIFFGLAGRLESEDAGGEGRCEIDVAGQETKPSVFGLGFEADDLLFKEKISRQPDAKFHSAGHDRRASAIDPII